MLVRDPARLAVTHDRLTVIQGDVTDSAQVAVAVKGADAVLSALGPAKGGPKDLFARATTAIVAAARDNGIARIVALTGAGVDVAGERKELGAKVASGIVKLVARDVVVDRQREYDILRASDRAWTLVRAPRLTDGPRTGGYRSGHDLQLGPSNTISRADVAEFMLQQVDDERYVGQAPFVSD